MNRLQTELQRLYLQGGAGAEDTGQVRALVLELARPADWRLLAPLWHGVQDDLALPAPAIVANGVDGYQLWFSLLQPVPVADALGFLEGLRRRYLAEVAPARITAQSAVEAVPALRKESGQWSAFIARDLAAVFADEPWLDMQPSPEAQADVLSRLKSIKPADFQNAFEALMPAAEAAPPPPPRNAEATAPGASQDPKRFLLEVMGDANLDLHLRIEAARALLPYFEKPRGA